MKQQRWTQIVPMMGVVLVSAVLAGCPKRPEVAETSPKAIGPQGAIAFPGPVPPAPPVVSGAPPTVTRPEEELPAVVSAQPHEAESAPELEVKDADVMADQQAEMAPGAGGPSQMGEVMPGMEPKIKEGDVLPGPEAPDATAGAGAQAGMASMPDGNGTKPGASEQVAEAEVTPRPEIKEESGLQPETGVPAKPEEGETKPGAPGQVAEGEGKPGAEAAVPGAELGPVPEVTSPQAGEAPAEEVSPPPSAGSEAVGPVAGAPVAAPAPEPPAVAEAPKTPELTVKDIFFDFDQSVIREDSRKTLSDNLQWLKINPGAKVTLEGHCDERGSSEYNLALGERRATATRDFLVAGGVETSRINTISYGKERPFVLGHDESAWRWNRRAHFVIITK